MRATFCDPLFDDFKAQLDPLHVLAESNAGFVWRYQGEKDSDGYIKPYADDPMIMGNMSAWRDYDSLFRYVFTEEHLALMRMKRKWFNTSLHPWTVLYYGTEESLKRSNQEILSEAKQRLEHLVIYGETKTAFGFGHHQGIL